VCSSYGTQKVRVHHTAPKNASLQRPHLYTDASPPLACNPLWLAITHYDFTHVDGWMDGWVGGWMDGWMD